MNVTFDHGEDVTATIRSFYFKPEQPVRYEAGQFTELRLPHPNPDSRGEARWFTLSSSPTESLLTVTTRHAADHGSTFKQALWALQPGTALDLAAPMGDMVLPKDVTRPLVYVAGGMGITPVRSMIKYLLDAGEQRTIHLIHAVEHEADLIFAPLFQNYKMVYTPVVKTPASGWTGECGRLTPQRVMQLAGNGRPLMYLSGPEPMVADFAEALKAVGITQDTLITDSFPGYTQI